MKVIFFLASIFIATLSFTQIPNYVPTSGLVGWWPFNGNANDESGNGNNGTVNGAMLTSDRNGNANKAYNFDGGINCQNITIPNSPELNPNNITINCWINALDSNMTIIEKNDPSDAYKLGYGITFKDEWQGFKGLKTSYGSGNCFSYNHPVFWSPQNSFPNNNWIMITVVISANGNVYQYLNSNLVYSVMGTTSFSPCNNPFSSLRIGGPHWNNDPECFNGKIDDIGIWNRALTQCEIQDLYNAQLGFTSINAGIDQTVCAGTSVLLSGSGANTYSWNNGVSNAQSFTPNTTQDYIVTGVDSSGCIGNDTVSVVVLEPTFSTQTETACNSYTWIDGINYTTSNNTAIFNLVNSVGCDSVVTLNLTINNPSVGSQTETALDSYTWPLNNQTYSQSGTYTDTIPNAVGCDSIVTLNLTLNFSGINELNQSKLIITPNPAKDNFSIIGLDKLGNVNSMVLKDLNGKTVKVLDPKATQFKITELNKGVYFLTISAGEMQEVIKLIKE